MKHDLWNEHTKMLEDLLVINKEYERDLRFLANETDNKISKLVLPEFNLKVGDCYKTEDSDEKIFTIQRGFFSFENMKIVIILTYEEFDTVIFNFEDVNNKDKRTTTKSVEIDVFLENYIKV